MILWIFNQSELGNLKKMTFILVGGGFGIIELLEKLGQDLVKMVFP